MSPKTPSISIVKRQAAFDKFALRCMEAGYMPNWARMQYQNKFKEWPCSDNGIKMPAFFFKYEQRVKRRKAQQLEAQQAANE